jgi:hypothetical protein
MVNKLKVTAIIFIILLFLLETIYIVWSFLYYYSEQEKTSICYYDVCEDYPEVLYQDNICYCYDYDVIGNLQVVKTEYMK